MVCGTVMGFIAVGMSILLGRGAGEPVGVAAEALLVLGRGAAEATLKAWKLQIKCEIFVAIASEY
jgi:hypothetical protein